MGKKTKRLPLNSMGKIIREAREKKRMTEEELSWKFNTSEVTTKVIKNWERGFEFPDLDMIYKLSEFLDVNPNELLNIRNTIQDESMKEPNQAARRVFGRFFLISKPALKFVFEVVLGACVIYLAANYKNFENKVGGQNDPEQFQFVANIIEDGINQYVNGVQNEPMFDKYNIDKRASEMNINENTNIDNSVNYNINMD